MAKEKQESKSENKMDKLAENISSSINEWNTPYIAALCVQCNVPAIFMGDPGIGKTSMVEAIGRVLSPKRIVSPVVLSTMDPADVHGMPVIINGSVRLAPPPYIQKLQNEEYGILFFDEITNSPQSTQAAALRGIYNREFGETRLGVNIAILAAGNPQETASDAHDLTPAFANRFAHFQYSIPSSVWTHMAMMDFKTNIGVTQLPKDWMHQRPKTLGLILGFLKHRPDMLIKVPDNESDRGKAWPSPRSWYDMALPLMAASMALNAPQSIQTMLLEGCVGNGVTTEFLAWSQNMDLPDPEEVLKAPKKYKIPKRSDIAYVVLTSVMTAILTNNTPDRWSNGWELLENFADNDLSDIALLSARTLAQEKPENYTPPQSVDKFLDILKRFESIA